MNLVEAKRRLGVDILWKKFELPGEPGSSCRSPFRNDEHPSFSVSEDGQRFFDFAEGKGGDAIDFLQRATGLSPSAACKKFIKWAEGLPATLGLLSPADGHREQRCGAVFGQRADKSLSHIFNLPKFVTEVDTARNRWLLEQLASRRHLRMDGVRLAHQRGLLKFCFLRTPGYVNELDWCPKSDEPAWAIMDRTRYNVQVRWLSGDRIGRQVNSPKAKTWPGSSARWPIGIHEAQTYPLIVLVEGGPDLLAAHHFAELAGAEDEVGVVGMMGAGMNIHPEALPLFAGKRVRIVPDADDPGREAAERWAQDLREAGAEVDAFSLEGLRQAGDTLVKDLNDCCLIDPDDADELEGLFIV